MKAKKSKKAELKNKSVLFLEIGFIVAIGAVLAAFQWTSKELIEPVLNGSWDGDYEAQLVPVPRTEPEKNEPPNEQRVSAIEIVEELDEFEEMDFGLFSSEANPDQLVAVIPMEGEKEVEEDKVLTRSEIMPGFPGGDRALLRFIATHVKYPELAKENGVEGRVYVGFVVNKRGQVEQVQVVKGVDPLLNNEARRIIESLPKWSPGFQGGRAVNVCFTVPINFKLS